MRIHFPPGMSHAQKLRFAWAILFSIMIVEGIAAYALWVHHGEVLAAMLVMSTWVRDGAWSAVEHLWLYSEA